jgi:hypothetical protein
MRACHNRTHLGGALLQEQGVAYVNIAVDPTPSSSQDLDVMTFLVASSFSVVWERKGNFFCDPSSCSEVNPSSGPTADPSSSANTAFRHSGRVAVIITAMFALLDFACPTIGTGGQANN